MLYNNWCFYLLFALSLDTKSQWMMPCMAIIKAVKKSYGEQQTCELGWWKKKRWEAGRRWLCTAKVFSLAHYKIRPGKFFKVLSKTVSKSSETDVSTSSHLLKAGAKEEEEQDGRSRHNWNGNLNWKQGYRSKCNPAYGSVKQGRERNSDRGGREQERD